MPMATEGLVLGLAARFNDCILGFTYTYDLTQVARDWTWTVDKGGLGFDSLLEKSTSFFYQYICVVSNKKKKKISVRKKKSYP